MPDPTWLHIKQVLRINTTLTPTVCAEFGALFIRFTRSDLDAQPVLASVGSKLHVGSTPSAPQASSANYVLYLLMVCK